MVDENEVARAVERVRLELLTRHFMVMVLALIGVWTGIAMILTGAPAFIETWFSPWSRYLIGGSALVAGMLTVGGGFVGEERRCGWWAQAIGLSGMTLWYAGMSVAYVGLTIHEGWEIVGPGQALSPGDTGRGYVPFIYLGLMLMTATPLVTMVRLRRPGRIPGEPLDGPDSP